MRLKCGRSGKVCARQLPYFVFLNSELLHVSQAYISAVTVWWQIPSLGLANGISRECSSRRENFSQKRIDFRFVKQKPSRALYMRTNKISRLSASLAREIKQSPYHCGFSIQQIAKTTVSVIDEKIPPRRGCTVITPVREADWLAGCG